MKIFMETELEVLGMSLFDNNIFAPTWNCVRRKLSFQYFISIKQYTYMYLILEISIVPLSHVNYPHCLSHWELFLYLEYILN